MKKSILMAVALVATASAARGQDPMTLTVDAAEGAYVALAAEARVVEVADPISSTDWTLGFSGTNIVANGGDAGPGGVTLFCICQNASATNDEVLALTPATELGDFTAVTAEDVPSADSEEWHPASMATYPWYRYNLAFQHQIWPTYNVYLVRRGGEVFKVQVVGYYGADGTPRQVSFRYERL